MRGALFLCILAAALLPAQDITFDKVELSVVQQRFGRLRSKNAERAVALREIFEEAGCPPEHWSEIKVRGSKLPNLACTLPGTSARQVIITAHYDQTGGGQGAIDNWAGAALLPSLYQSLKKSATHADTRLRFADG
jgi:8-oxo-dGTP pyrophosphatase MutT (NUDIX family)